MRKRVTTRRRAAKAGAKKAGAKKPSAKKAVSGEEAAAPKRRGRSKAAAVKKILKKVEAKLKSDEVKATLGDYIRLVQLEKELTEEEPRYIKVTWVEPATESER